MSARRTEIVLFTRDLRVQDNPALTAAVDRADRVIPLFVHDEAIARGRFSNRRREAFLLSGLADLDASLRRRGAALVIRRGDPVLEVMRLAAQFDVAAVHLAADVSAHAAGRERRLHRALEEQGRTLVVHEASITCHPGDALQPTGGDHYKVFTPYHRQWEALRQRDVLAAPEQIRLPGSIAYGDRPAPPDETKTPGETGTPGGETAARERARAWVDDGLAAYEDRRDDLGADATSRMSADLHLGFVSIVELVGWVRQQAGPGAESYVRQLAWRDFHHQMLAARPEAAWQDYRPRGDHWRDSAADLSAWQQGRTGYPLVDAGMRELNATGFMHNRSRMVVASFLTKTLYLDWRLGAQYFLDHLVDGDLANNNLNWQWVAGTGADTRPNRVLNPIRQATRYDPRAEYVRRWIPELADLEPLAAREPWRLPPPQRRSLDYPEPIVDLDAARERFHAGRDAAQDQTHSSISR